MLVKLPRMYKQKEYLSYFHSEIAINLSLKLQSSICCVEKYREYTITTGGLTICDIIMSIGLLNICNNIGFVLIK